MLSFIIASTLLAAAPEFTVIRTNPETPGRQMTMQEATVERGVRPRQCRPSDFGWTPAAAHSELTSREGSLWLHDTVLVAKGGDGIVYGEPVSRHEFGIDTGIFRGPEGRYAFYCKDESAVRQFPLLDLATARPRLIRYPMTGDESEVLRLGIFDVSTGQTVYSEPRTDYITNVCWSPSGRLFAQLVDRAQHNSQLVEMDVRTGEFGPAILSEHDDAWTEPLDPIWFFGADEGVFVYRTDGRHGYRNFYLCDMSGECRRIVQTDADLSFVAIEGDYLYYTSAEVSPLERHLFRVRVSGRSSVGAARIGKPERLTSERGWHSISVVPGCGFIDNFSSFEGECFGRTIVPGRRVRYGAKTDTTPDKGYARGRVELGAVPSADGLYDNYYRLTYPVGYEEGKQYPLVVYVYGGPHSQMVTEGYLGLTRYWDQLMAAKGYLVYTQDNRGTQNRGARYERAINRHCGEAEAADQLRGIDVLIERGLVDTSRVAVHGWSYGGFMTLTLATERPGLFKAAVAGGPVIDWRWYEVMYGERYMDTPQANPDGYAASSLVPKASRLKAATMIFQGAEDDTVVLQNCYSFIQECIGQGIRIDFFTFPCAEHNMRGAERVYLYDRVTDFIDSALR